MVIKKTLQISLGWGVFYLKYRSRYQEVANPRIPTKFISKNKPDLKPLISASSMIAKFIKKGSLIIFESTVYPGATEEVCVPVLEEISSLKF